ncbi:MAG: Ig-like domain-containing protein, partial [Beijerinckiaceae bacterium]
VDPDGEPVTFTTTSVLPAGLTLNPDGTVTGTIDPAASQGGDPLNPGFYLITVNVSDGTVTTPITLRIDVSNPPPVAADDTGMVTEDITATGNVLTGLGADTDPDGDAIAVTGFTIPGLAGTFLPGASAMIPGVGSFTLSATGTYSFMPAANYDGAVPVITYMISDGEGGFASATLTLTIMPVNDRPVIIDPMNPGTLLNPTPAPDPLNIIPDVRTSDSLTPPALNVSDYVRDPEGRALTYAAPDLPPGLTINPMTGLISGVLSSTASQGGPAGNGIYPVTITITDPEGLSTTTTITYTVTNPPPVAVNDTGRLSEDMPRASGNLLTGLGTDSDPDGDPIRLTSASYNGMAITPDRPFTLPNGAVLVLNSDGSYSFAPGTAYNSLPLGRSVTETIVYTITDGDGAMASATLTLTITGENDPPVLVDPLNPSQPGLPQGLPARTGLDSGSVSIPLAPFLRDPDGDPLTYRAAGLPPGLSLDPVTGLISGVLPANASQGGPLGNGVYAVTLTVTDINGASITTTFSFTASNPPPVAMTDTGSARSGVPTQINVLSNDADPDGDVLTVVSASSPDGAVSILPDGTLVFTPTLGFTGEAVVTYTISDGNGGTATARVLVDVRTGVVALPPAATPGVFEVQTRQQITGVSDGGLSVLLANRGNAERGQNSDVFQRFLETPLEITQGSTAEFFTRTFLGSSVGMELVEGITGDTLWVETMLYDGTFMLKVFEKGPDGKIRVVEHKLVSTRDIRWLEKAGRDVHIGLPPLDVGQLEVTIEATLSSGEIVSRQIMIQPQIGQVSAVKEVLPIAPSDPTLAARKPFLGVKREVREVAPAL